MFRGTYLVFILLSAVGNGHLAPPGKPPRNQSPTPDGAITLAALARSAPNTPSSEPRSGSHATGDGKSTTNSLVPSFAVTGSPQSQRSASVSNYPPPPIYPPQYKSLVPSFAVTGSPQSQLPHIFSSLLNFSHQISHVKLCLHIIDGYKKNTVMMCVGNLVKPAARRQHFTSSLILLMSAQ